MRQTRVITMIVAAAVASGLTMLALSDAPALVVAGAILVTGGGVALTRHFWRKVDQKRKQESARLGQRLTAEIAKIGDASDSAHRARQGEIENVSERVDAFAQGVLEYLAQFQLDQQEAEKTQQDIQASLLDRLEVIQKRTAESEASLLKRLDSADRQASRYRDNVVTQLSGIVGLYATLQPKTTYPSFGGWAIGGDCALRLISLIYSMRPRWIIEAGSGLSTILAAQTLDLIGGDRQIISLEHESRWLERSEAMVAEHGVSHRSEIFHAPLVETPIGDEKFLWYDLSRLELPDEVEIIFIDGPPQATGRLARYPALPMLFDRLRVGGVILMDDAARPDEEAAVDRWKQEHPELEFQYYPDSKGTIEITKGAR